MQAISPWSNPPAAEGAGLGVVTVEAGVLTDLIETSSECTFNYNVDPKIAEASVPNPDPYTGAPPKCVVPVRGDGSSLILTSSETQPPLTFQLNMPAKGMAQVAYITGAADATVKLTDSFGGDPQTYEGCTFAASVKLHKIAKP